jgi:hypothetical protein
MHHGVGCFKGAAIGAGVRASGVVTMTSEIDFSNRRTGSRSMDDQPISYGKLDTHEHSDDQLCEGTTNQFTDASEGQPWLSAEMVSDYDAPCGCENFQIIDLGESACFSTWLQRRRKRERLLQRKR